MINKRKKYQEKHGIPTRVNMGGGNFLRHDWINMDQPSKWYPYKEGVIDCKFDLTSGEPFPFKDNSIDLFYSCHTIEHIGDENFEHILSEIYRSLKPGGGLRISVPCYDLMYEKYEKCWKDDLDGERKFLDEFVHEFAQYFSGRVPVGEFQKNFQKMNRSELADHYCSLVPRDFQEDHAGYHISWWNFEKAKTMLKKANFSEVKRSEAFKSQFPEFNKRAKMFGLEKFFSLQSMLEFESKAAEITGEPDVSLYVDAVK